MSLEFCPDLEFSILFCQIWELMAGQCYLQRQKIGRLKRLIFMVIAGI